MGPQPERPVCGKAEEKGEMGTGTPYRWPVCVAAVLAVLTAVGFRTQALFHASLWGDEAFSVILAQAPASYLVTRPIVEHPHPPLYYAILKAAGGIFGLSEGTARGVSVVFGVATVLLMIVASRVLGATWEGVLASWLLAWSYLSVHVSQLVRMYSLLGFLALLALLLLARALADRRWQWWVWYGLCGVLLLYTHYLGGIVILALVIGGGACLLLDREKRSGGLAWLRLLVVHCAILLAFLPWAGRLLKHLGGLSSYMRIQELVRFGQQTPSTPIWLASTAIRLVSLLSFGERLPGRALGGLSIAIFLVLALWGLVRLLRTHASLGVLLASATVVPALFLVALSPRVPLQPPARYFALVLPGYLLVLASGMVGVAEAVGRRLGRWAGGCAVGILVLLCLGLTLPGLAKLYRGMPHADYRQVARRVVENRDAGDALVCLRAKEYALLDWYAAEPLPEGWHALGVDFPWASRELAPGLTLAEYSSVVGRRDRFVHWADSVETVAIGSLEVLLERSSQVWFLYALSETRLARESHSIIDPLGMILDWLEERYRRREIFSGDRFSLVLYEIHREE
ncbi:hypothetical protein AMJ39_06400 [candidate division TA06 bacterium DG_24]|uniref:Glycosyltransferase RgtA/B/C/D-like domain-containing protein n=2 Tax=Bacteria division TA06 TaxID=1156500 RepID=A0A0S8G2E3_UNCT6|nr:MAG: hypothetical protein AMJ39_06400 [candidate division TA06 bacterium DG_24]KPK66356.1 MAG: hypothetical protein AMJ82_11885 [candidate division TA06 bacterium SM23_40]